MEEHRIKIPRELKYKVELPEGIYYPAFLGIVDFDKKGEPYLRKKGVSEINYFLPQKEDTLFWVIRSIDIKHLKHINFPNPKDEPPKIFIHEGLAKILGSIDFDYIDYISTNLIKSVSEVKDYNKFFEMFKWGTKTSKKFKNEKGEFFEEFDKEPPKDYLSDLKDNEIFKPVK